MYVIKKLLNFKLYKRYQNKQFQPTEDLKTLELKFKSNVETYAEQGDDILIKSILQSVCRQHSLWNIRYLEIGGYHPIKISCTYLIYKAGARGVVIEPVPSFAERIKRYRGK